MKEVLYLMKKFFLGFLTAALLFSALPIGAAVRQYTLKPATAKFTIDGVEIKDEKLPLLFLDPGYNYIPAAMFRQICDKIGVGFKWDNETKAMEIDTKGTDATTTGAVTVDYDKTNDKITSTPDGISDIEFHDGKYYIPFYLIKNKYADSGYRFMFFDVNNRNKLTIFMNDALVSDNIHVTWDYGFSYIEYEYYVNSVLPLLSISK